MVLYLGRRVADDMAEGGADCGKQHEGNQGDSQGILQWQRYFRGRNQLASTALMNPYGIASFGGSEGFQQSFFFTFPSL